MSSRSHSPRRLESGQALIEYTVLIPLSILITIFAAGIVSALTYAYQETYRGLTCGGVGGAEERPDNLVVNVHNHRIELVGQVYQASNNTTTVTYRVSSGDAPSISHWVLGIPASVNSRIVSVSEQSAYSNPDPTTGAIGLKFDTGYEGTGGGGGGGGRRSRDGERTVRSTSTDAPVETRLIIITLRGEFTFDEVPVTTKAGTDQVGSGVISAPVSLKDSADTNPLDCAS